MNRLPDRQTFAHFRGLVGVLLSDPRIGRWPVIADVVLLACGQVSVLIAISGAMEAYRAGESAARFAALFALGMLCTLGAETWARTKASRAFTRAVASRQRHIVAELRRTSLSQLEAIGQSTVRARLTSDAARVVEAGPIIVLLLSETLVTALTIAYGLFGDTRSVTLFVLLAALSAIPISVLGSQAEALARDFEDNRETLFGVVESVIDGFAQVKVHRPRSEALGAAYAADTAAHLGRGELMYRAFNTTEAVTQGLLFCLIGALALGYTHIVPEASAEADRLVLAALFVFDPVAHVIIDQLEAARGGAALARMDRLIATLADAPGEPPDASGEGFGRFEQLELRGVRFAYPDTPGRPGFAIGPIDLTLRPGEVVFVTGSNGSGKSTLLEVLTGLYARTDGELRINGRPMPALPPATARDLFGAIFADFTLFERGYGLGGVEPARVRALLAEMELDHVVGYADGAFSTVELSTGQRKRLAMVVTLLRDRPILVFDEWAADQDPRFRERFYRRLLPALAARGKAIIAVTHDDAYFDAADRRLHLADGRIT